MKQWRGLKMLGGIVTLCAALLGTGLGSTVEVAHAETWDPNAIYRITNVNSGYVPDVYHENTGNGENIYQHKYVGKTCEQWRIQPTGDGYYKLVNVNSNKVADVAESATWNGGNIHQWEYVGGENQKWSLELSGQGGYKIVNKHSGKVMDVEHNSMHEANIHQWDYLGLSSQHWYIEKINSPISEIDPTRYYKLTDTATGKVMDISGRSKSAGALALTYYWNGGDNQRFRIVPWGPEGTYAIIAKHSRFEIGAPEMLGGQATVRQYDPANGGYQWNIDRVGTGTYKLRLPYTNAHMYASGDHLFVNTSWPGYTTWSFEIVE